MSFAKVRSRTPVIDSVLMCIFGFGAAVYAWSPALDQRKRNDERVLQSLQMERDALLNANNVKNPEPVSE